jgi:uncharacterized protein YkwD
MHALFRHLPSTAARVSCAGSRETRGEPLNPMDPRTEKPARTSPVRTPPDWRVALLCGALILHVPGARAMEPEQVPARLLTPVSVVWPDDALFAESVLLASNAERARYGVPPLIYDPMLGQVAADQARNMALLRTLSHSLPIEGQEGYRQRLRRLGVRYRAAAENIAIGKLYQLLGRPISRASEGCAFTYGDTGAPVPIHSYASLGAEVVTRWMASPQHRVSLLSPKYSRLGVGIGGDPEGTGCGDLYMAQTFAD